MGGSKFGSFTMTTFILEQKQNKLKSPVATKPTSPGNYKPLMIAVTSDRTMMNSGVHRSSGLLRHTVPLSSRGGVVIPTHCGFYSLDWVSRGHFRLYRSLIGINSPVAETIEQKGYLGFHLGKYEIMKKKKTKEKRTHCFKNV